MHSFQKVSCAKSGAHGICMDVRANKRKRGAVNDKATASDVDSASECDDAQSSIGETTTPLTPLSPRPNQRYPSDLKRFSCTFEGCIKAFNRPAKLEQHVRSHTNTRSFVCPHPPCSKSFLRDSHLKHHIKSAHTDERDYACAWQGCGKSFATGTRLRRHQAVHEGRERFKCTIDDCGLSFRKHNTLQAHILSVHERVKPYQCGFLNDDGQRCGAGFDTAHKLRDHEGRLHRTKRYTCTICPPEEGREEESVPGEGYRVAFSTYAALQGHIASCHPPICKKCGLQCLSQAALKSHVEVYHSGLNVDQRRKEACPIEGCAAAFTKRSNLNIHVRMVHEGKRYICENTVVQGSKELEAWSGLDACGASFSSKARMVEHVRAMHLGLANKPVSAAKRRRRGQKEQPSVMDNLTRSQRPAGKAVEVRCPEPGCEWPFLGLPDFEQHMKDVHGCSDGDLRVFMLGISDDMPSVSEPIVDTEATGVSSQDGPEQNGGNPSKINELGSNDCFWIGAHGQQVSAIDGFIDPWLDEEGEMRRLIDGV